MAKDRDLFDYLSLGNELLQTSRLGDIRDGQAALVALEAKRLESEQRREIAELREDNIRDFVFGASKWLRTLRVSFGQSKPLATLVLLYGAQRHIESLGISTERVRSYDDKERVHALLEDVKRAVSDCEARLDPNGIRDAVTCAKYKAEAHALAVVIEHDEEQVKFRKRRKKLKRMERPKTAHSLLQLFSAVICVIGLIPLLTFFTADEHVSYTTADVGCIVAAIALTILGAWGAIPKSKNEALDGELTTSEHGSNIVESLRRDFGGARLEELRKLQAERKAFIEKVLPEDVMSALAMASRIRG